MDIKEFEYLVTIAEQGSVTKAANQLFVTQSALSKFVQKKEAEMGTPLFKRVGKQFVPTFAGEKCIDAARRVLTINRQLNAEVDQIAKEGKGRIRLAFHSSWAGFFFMIIYPLFHTKHPDVDLQIYELSTAAGLEMMDRGDLDIFVTAAVWNKHSRYTCEVLREQRMVLAVKDGHPLFKEVTPNPNYAYPYIDFKKLEGVPLIMRHLGCTSRDYVTEQMYAHEVVPHTMLEAASRENAIRAVEYGMGVTFVLDDPVLLFTHKAIRFIAYNEEGSSKCYTNIIYNKGSQLPEAEETLLKMIRNNYHLFD